MDLLIIKCAVVLLQHNIPICDDVVVRYKNILMIVDSEIDLYTYNLWKYQLLSHNLIKSNCRILKIYNKWIVRFSCCYIDKFWIKLKHNNNTIFYSHLVNPPIYCVMYNLIHHNI